MKKSTKSEASNRHKLFQCRSSSVRGFSLVELLVATIVASSVIGVASTIVFSNRNLYLKDSSRTQVNQNIRAAIDLVGFDVRQAGERLPDDFPAVVLNEAGNPAGSDTLVVYRSISDIVLNVCNDVNSGSTSDVDVAIVPSDPANLRCLPDAVKLSEIGVWETLRNDNGGMIDAYIYDPINRVGEFFSYDSADTGNFTISRSGGGWTNDYPVVNAPRLYLMEERQFFLSSLNPDPAMCSEAGEFLTLVINGDCTNQRFGLTNDMDDFQVQVCLQSGGACVESLTFSEAANSVTGWTDISSIDVSVTSSKDFAAGRDTSRTVESRFFPRNVLSF
ncbi:MAG: PilW family protein [Synechococcus sp.]